MTPRRATTDNRVNGELAEITKEHAMAGNDNEIESISRGPRYPLATPGEDVPGPDGLK